MKINYKQIHETSLINKHIIQRTVVFLIKSCLLKGRITDSEEWDKGKALDDSPGDLDTKY